MPRKTGYTTRSASTTLVLGDPELGTCAWDTEYDVEFTDGRRQVEKRSIGEAKASSRASLRTPRSLKKGYVSGEDYDKLDEQYHGALLAYRDLQLQVGTLEERMAAMQGGERQLLRAVGEQHAAVETLRQQVAAMMDGLGQLIGGVERNKALLEAMNRSGGSSGRGGGSYNGSGYGGGYGYGGYGQVPVSPSKPARASEQREASEAAAEFISRRLSALEARIGDMAEAVAELSRARTLALTSMRPGTTSWPGASVRMPNGREAPARRPSRSLGRRDSSNNNMSGERHAMEKIERLPNPVHIATRSSLWRP